MANKAKPRILANIEAERRVRATAIERALRMLIQTPHVRRYLEENDPKALHQADCALGGVEVAS